MPGTLHLRVITPDRIALDTEVSSLRMPGLDGSIGILPGHAAMVAALDVGVLHYEEDGRKQSLFVSGGFLEVAKDEVSVVTQAGEKPVEIDEKRAREAEARARERLSLGKTTTGEALDLIRAQLALRRALMRLTARGERE